MKAEVKSFVSRQLRWALVMAVVAAPFQLLVQFKNGFHVFDALMLQPWLMLGLGVMAAVSARYFARALNANLERTWYVTGWEEGGLMIRATCQMVNLIVCIGVACLGFSRVIPVDWVHQLGFLLFIFFGLLQGVFMLPVGAGILLTLALARGISGYLEARRKPRIRCQLL